MVRQRSSLPWKHLSGETFDGTFSRSSCVVYSRRKGTPADSTHCGLCPWPGKADPTSVLECKTRSSGRREERKRGLKYFFLYVNTSANVDLHLHADSERLRYSFLCSFYRSSYWQGYRSFYPAISFKGKTSQKRHTTVFLQEIPR